MDIDNRILRNAGIKENGSESLDEGIGSKMMGLVGLQARPTGTMPRVPGSVPSGANLDPFWGAFSTGLQGLLTGARKFEESRDRQSYIELMKSYDSLYKMNVPDKVSPLGRKLLDLLGISKKAYISQQSGLEYIDKIADTLANPDIQTKLFIGEDEPLPPQVAMGEDKPEPVQGQEEAPAQQKKRVLPKRPAKRVNDDNIAGMYKELDRQIAQNAKDSMKKPS
jgi:hypothetical protein